MCSIDNFAKFININMQMQIKKVVYLSEYDNSSKNELLNSYQKKIKLPGFENSDKIDNYGSLYVQDFEIKKIKDNNIQPKVCIFNTLPENNLNPFLAYAKLNDLQTKKIIDLRNLKNTEEPDFFFLNEILSQ